MNIIYASNNTVNKIKLKKIVLDIENKKKHLFSQQQKKKNIFQKLQNEEKHIAIIGKKIHEIYKTSINLTINLINLNKKINFLKKVKKKHELLLSKQLNILFKLGKQTNIELLLTGKTGQKKKRILAYLNYLNLYRQQNINKLKCITKKLIKQQKEKQKKQFTQKQNLIVFFQKKRLLIKIQNLRKKTLSFLNTSLNQQRMNLKIMKNNEFFLRKKILKAQQKYKINKNNPIYINYNTIQKKKINNYINNNKKKIIKHFIGLGKPMKQILWPVYGKVVHHYGDNISKEIRWKGIVINAPEGTEVKAISAGYVLLSDWLQGYGLMVVIDHGYGDMSLYGYNQTTLVNVGQEVYAGQPVALIGNSGGQNDSRLYFQIRRKGETVNPESWLKKIN